MSTSEPKPPCPDCGGYCCDSGHGTRVQHVMHNKHRCGHCADGTAPQPASTDVDVAALTAERDKWQAAFETAANERRHYALELRTLRVDFAGLRESLDKERTQYTTVLRDAQAVIVESREALTSARRTIAVVEAAHKRLAGTLEVLVGPPRDFEEDRHG